MKNSKSNCRTFNDKVFRRLWQPVLTDKTQIPVSTFWTYFFDKLKNKTLMKKIILALLTFIATRMNCTPITHTITYNVTTSVTCTTGDTLKLYGTYSGDYVASTTSGTTTISNIFPTMVSSSPYYIGYFLITGSETSLFFAEISQGQTTVTINSSLATGVLEQNISVISNVFPNPFKDKLTVKSSETTQFDLLSSRGDLIRSIIIQQGETIIDLTTYPNALYFLRNKDTAYKILKE